MANYIPDTEAAYDDFMTNFLTVLAPNIAPLGILVEQLTVLQTAHSDYTTSETQRNSALTAYNGLVMATSLTAYNGLVMATSTRRDSLTTQIRDLVRVIQNSPNMTDTLRTQLGITVPKTTRTPVGAPTTVPVLTVSMGMTRQHVIEFADISTPKSKAKPAGVAGCQLYELILPAGSPPPTDPTTFGFLALDTRAPYVVSHDAADIGKTAYYVACWQNNKGDTGPYGDIRALTIAG